MNEKIIFSDKILSYNREYLFDVKENSNGKPYLRITQIIKSPSDKTSQTIFIFKEDSKRFFEILQMALKKCDDEHFHKGIALEELRKIYKNAHKPWTYKDDEVLEKLYHDKESIEEMCLTLDRSPGEIEIRINILELEDKYGI